MTEKEREREATAEARNLGLHLGFRTAFCCFPRCNSRERDQKWSSQISNWRSNGCQHHRQQFNPLLHSAGPQFVTFFFFLAKSEVFKQKNWWMWVRGCRWKNSRGAENSTAQQQLVLAVTSYLLSLGFCESLHRLNTWIMPSSGRQYTHITYPFLTNQPDTFLCW